MDSLYFHTKYCTNHYFMKIQPTGVVFLKKIKAAAPGIEFGCVCVLVTFIRSLASYIGNFHIGGFFVHQNMRKKTRVKWFNNG